MTGPVQATSVEIPSYSVFVEELGPKNPVIGLLITTNSTLHKFLLCAVDDADAMADLVAEQIRTAGVDARRARLGLVVAKGGMGNGLRPVK